MQRVISINGLSTEDAPGTLSRNVDQLPVWQRRIFGSLNPIPGDLPDGMSPHLLPARELSRFSVRDYPSDIKLTELKDLLEQIRLSSKMPDDKLSEKLIDQDANVEAAEK